LRPVIVQYEIDRFPAHQLFWSGTPKKTNGRFVRVNDDAFTDDPNTIGQKLHQPAISIVALRWIRTRFEFGILPTQLPQLRKKF
jgi:hypothetical protein